MSGRVLISDKLSPAAVKVFADRGIEADYRPELGADKAALAAAIGSYDGLAVRSITKVTAKVIERAGRLKVIGRAGIGVDNIDLAAASARGIIVMNTPLGNAITTAEHTVSLMMALARQIPAADASTRAGKWEKNRFMGVELFNKTLGIIGCGNIGSIVADLALGLRMKVIAYDPYLSPERAIEIRVEKVDFDELLNRADFISLHTPLTDRTRHIIDEKALARMKRGARVINCARGGLVVEEALAAALGADTSAGRRSTCSKPSLRSTIRCLPSTTSSARPISAPRPRGPGERCPADRRADGRLSQHRRRHQRPQHALDHR
jgi:D-3-phosphoglycerate dehydrogenase / 2-oxoglutarate reductase